MSNTRVKVHPHLGILVCTDGHVMLPATKGRPAKWTFGWDDGYGYMRVNTNKKNYRVHRLVAEAFIQYPIPKGLEIDHINRIRHDNRLENIRIVSRFDNHRNTSANDRVEVRGGTHSYEDKSKYNREKCAHYYALNRERLRERRTYRYQRKRKTHKLVHFADGSKHWIPHEEALELLKIPLKQRIFAK